MLTEPLVVWGAAGSCGFSKLVSSPLESHHSLFYESFPQEQLHLLILALHILIWF